MGFGHAGDEVVKEGEGAYLLEEFFDGGEFFGNGVVDAEVGCGEGVEVFEHAGGCAGGGDELEDAFALEVLLVEGGVFVDVGIVEPQYAAVVDGGGIDKDRLGKSPTEVG